MYVQRLLQIMTAVTASLGTLLLGMGQRNSLIPVCVAIAAAMSVWLTDITGIFRLNRMVTNIAALFAGLLSLWEVSRYGGSMQVLGLANLLVYLQIILLFQEKEYRTYWQLAILSLAQVFVATAFGHTFLFGLLLIVYLASGLAMLALLYLYREQSLYSRATDQNPGVFRKTGTGSEPMCAKAGNKSRTRGACPPFQIGSNDAESNESNRWPLSRQTTYLDAATPGSMSRIVVDRAFWFSLVRLAFGTALLSLLIFFTVPRLGRSAWRGAGVGSLRTVGYSGRVQLGALGKVLENPEEVLRIEFSEESTGEEYRITGDVYLRGAVQTHYKDGQWEYHRVYDSMGRHYLSVNPPRPGDPKPLVRQSITIEPMAREEVFCVWPFEGFEDREDRRLKIDCYQWKLTRDESVRSRRYVYELGTTAFINGMQTELIPNTRNEGVDHLLNLPPDEGRNAMPGLKALADQWMSQTTLEADDRYGRAKLMQRMLSTSDRFEYSLTGQDRDLSLDPIEDFVTKHPRGHCEYFATALVLMLRHQGIPARLVMGFKTDEWNDLGRFYQVRQLHAHAWVEAYLEPTHITPDAIEEFDASKWAHGGWLRLEPTPAAPEFEMGATATILKRADRYLTWLDYIWDNYVMEMDRPRQRRAVYDPATFYAKEAYRRLTDLAWWNEGWQSLKRWMADGNQWFHWRAGLVVMLLLGLIVGIVRLLRRLVHGLRERFGHVSDESTPAARWAQVAFYRRFEKILARTGMRRTASQTQREFALEASKQLLDKGRSPLDTLPDQIVDAFYQVRFGDTTLDSPQSEAVERALEQLENAPQHGRENAPQHVEP